MSTEIYPPPTGLNWVRLVEFNSPFCAVSTTDSLHCWGQFIAEVPTLQSGWMPFAADDFADIAPTRYGACATSTDGNMQCTGATTPTIPTLPQGTSWSHVWAGGNATCALDSDGHAWCWNWYSSSAISVPTLPAGVRWETIRVLGSGQMCGLTSDDEMQCWGTSNPVVPALPTGVSWTDQIACNDAGCCAMDSERSVWCFGGGASADAFMTDVTSIGMSRGHTAVCATRVNGPVACLELGSSTDALVLW